MDQFVDDDIEPARTEAPSVEWLKLSIKKGESLLEEFETLLDIDALQVSLLIGYLMPHAGAWVRCPVYHLYLQALASAISVYKLMPKCYHCPYRCIQAVAQLTVGLGEQNERCRDRGNGSMGDSNRRGQANRGLPRGGVISTTD